MKKIFFGSHCQRFSIRKYSVGVASVMLGLFLVGCPQAAYAEENTHEAETSEVTRLESESEASFTSAVLVKTDNLAEPVREVFEEAIVVSSENLVKEEDVINEDVVENRLTTLPDEKVDLVQPASLSTVGELSKFEGLTEVESFESNTIEARVSMRSANKISSVIGDDYPVEWKFRPKEYDTWGYNKSTCTSFVAHRLHKVNKFEIPRAIGDAGQWGYSARRLGYRVDNTPAIGSVAWTTNGEYGHVAWVAEISGNTVTVEEYNWDWDYKHHTRVMPISAYSGFIHFKDISGGITVSPGNSSDSGSTSGGTSLPSSGTYYFTSRKGIKAEAKISSPDLAFYDSGNSVNYDKTFVADNHEWISYLTYSGSRRYIAINRVSTPEKPEVKGNISIHNTEANSFDVIISNISSNVGLKDVQVPVWSETDGQDDLIWYKAVRQSNGDYKVTVRIADHKNNRGDYNVHLYYVGDNGKQLFVGGTKATLSKPANTEAPKPQGAISINNGQGGTFDVVIANVTSPKGVSQVKVPIWSTQDGQDDIVWYDATRQGDGTYKVSVNIKNHKNSQGEYNIHLYYIQNDGSLVGVGGTTTVVNITTQPPVPERGTYTFSGRASIKAEPKVSSPELAYYDAGNSVNYDSVLYSDGHYWISYIAVSGNRRYISIT